MNRYIVHSSVLLKSTLRCHYSVERNSINSERSSKHVKHESSLSLEHHSNSIGAECWLFLDQTVVTLLSISPDCHYNRPVIYSLHQLSPPRPLCHPLYRLSKLRYPYRYIAWNSLKVLYSTVKCQTVNLTALRSVDQTTKMATQRRCKEVSSSLIMQSSNYRS